MSEVDAENIAKVEESSDIPEVTSSHTDDILAPESEEKKCCDNCAKMTVNNYKNTGCPFGKYNPIIGKFEQVFPPKVNWDKFNDSCTRFELRKTDVEEKVSDAFSSGITYKRPY